MASDLTYDDYILEFPDQATNVTAEQNFIKRAVDKAEREIHRPTWGDYADDGVLYAAAHNLAMKARMSKHGAGAAGPTTARTSGENVTGFATLGRTREDATWASTNFGAEFLRMRDQLDLGPLVAS